MNTDTSAAPEAALNPAELALEIYKLLAPHPSETRVRAIQSAMASLGETAVLPSLSATKHITGAAQTTGEFGELDLGAVASCVGIWCGALSGISRVPDQAARSMI
jgi:hypothetical protein